MTEKDNEPSVTLDLIDGLGERVLVRVTRLWFSFEGRRYHKSAHTWNDASVAGFGQQVWFKPMAPVLLAAREALDNFPENT